MNYKYLVKSLTLLMVMSHHENKTIVIIINQN